MKIRPRNYRPDIASSELTKFNLISNPHFAGSYKLFDGADNNTLIVKLIKKPKFIHRYFTKLLLGWTWIDSE